MRPRHETMDEAIERVAASVTAVSVDPGFVTRLEVRLVARAPRAHGLWLMAASATAAVILAVVLNFDREAPRPRPTNPTQVAAIPDAPAMPTPGVTDQARPAETRVARVELEPAQAALDPVPQIAALDGPQTLTVGALVFEPLAIEPVAEPEVLALPDLEVRTIDDGAEQKEQ